MNTNGRDGGSGAGVLEETLEARDREGRDREGRDREGSPRDDSALMDMLPENGRAGTASDFGSSVMPAVRTVAICDTQPVTAEGIRTLLAANSDLQYQQTTDSLARALEAVRRKGADVLVVDKAFGIQAILEWLSEVGMTASHTSVVIWGVSVTEAEALRFLQAGARGILRRTASMSVVLACLRNVAEGRSWMEDSLFRDSSRSDRYPRSELTTREQQVLELVEQGFKNKEIAQDLGIRPGTVKIHLKHIFEKTGVRGRYGLALNGLKDRGLVSASV